jgi:hypothetical protein
MCQRFGMKRMGKDFEGISHPTECMSKCDEVFPSASLLQRVKTHPVHAEAAADPKTKR